MDSKTVVIIGVVTCVIAVFAFLFVTADPPAVETPAPPSAAPAAPQSP